MTHNYELKDTLVKKIKPINAKKVNNVEDLLIALKSCGFQGRNLGRALDILEKMVSDKKISTVLSLSGAMVPAGMGELVCELIEFHLIDVIITTGANITHDFIDAVMNGGHYLGRKDFDDEILFEYRVNRIYDVFLPDDNYEEAEEELLSILEKIAPSKNIELSPSELFHRIGQEISSRCILSLAAKNKIPIFVPAISDSEIALDLVKFTQKEGFNINLRVLEDVKKFANIIKKSKNCGTLIIGGGVPRNWAQQIYPYLEQTQKNKRRNNEFGYKYSVRIHTATEYDGGLSGCTISESKSWGKYTLDSRSVSVWCDATIAFPILVAGLLQRLDLA